MPLLTLNDLPIEVIQNFILPELTETDVRCLGNTGSKRLKVISDDYLRNYKCKFPLIY